MKATNEKAAGKTANVAGAGASLCDKAEAVEKKIADLCRDALNADAGYEQRLAAWEDLKEVDSVYSFNEYVREHGNPDDALEDMEYLDEIAECGGDWGKPSFVLARAFYGYRFNPWRGDGEYEAFNPNDEYFTFNGYANLVSVCGGDWGYYWAATLDAGYYVQAADDEGKIDELAEALELMPGVDYAAEEVA